MTAEHCQRCGNFGFTSNGLCINCTIDQSSPSVETYRRSLAKHLGAYSCYLTLLLVSDWFTGSYIARLPFANVILPVVIVAFFASNLLSVLQVTHSLEGMRRYGEPENYFIVMAICCAMIACGFLVEYRYVPFLRWMKITPAYMLGSGGFALMMILMSFVSGSEK